jgi:hypothetical protein
MRKVAVAADDKRLCAGRLVERSLQLRLPFPSKLVGELTARADGQFLVDTG